MLDYLLKNEYLEDEEYSDEAYDYTNEEPIDDDYESEDDYYEENESYTCD